MTVYTELENGSVTDGTLFIPNDPLNRDWQRVQQEVLDAVSTITPYAGSAEELAAAISEKVSELLDYFYSLHGVQFDMAIALELYYAPIAPSTPESTRYHSDVGVAAVAKTFVEALVDLPTVNNYNVVTDPGWTP